MDEIEKLKFYFRFNEDGTPNVWDYGVYRMGLTGDEIKDYIRVRANNLNINYLWDKFCSIAGCNTGSMSPDGQFLMYRWDVLRFADVLFGKTDYTYFD